ncbi:MAG: AraC family transcriptional regulator [Bacteroidetes bacterium HGW-Bacteroidetes-13]|nr:MAG: AraC family transcriptional regulator [Bacteroidetes bacterium HGW-Bacteroidetes-13]
MDTIIHVNSILQLHEMLNFEKPEHPLITIINVCDLEVKQEMVGVKVVTNLYCIALKDEHCGMEYGRTSYDFEKGTLLFTAPLQALTATKTLNKNEEEGWLLFFHPDLLLKSSLAQKINQYTFFEYEANEALHLSNEERGTLNNIISKIQDEYTRKMDRHSRSLIISKLESLLNYSLRFYERQFITRSSAHKSIVVMFESILNTSLEETNLSKEFPSIKYLAEKINLSPNYLSDILRKETGYSAKDYINNLVIKRAKEKLMGTNDSISEIAFSLGFNYPHYFTRFFKSKIGMTPSRYRKGN